MDTVVPRIFFMHIIQLPSIHLSHKRLFCIKWSNIKLNNCMTPLMSTGPPVQTIACWSLVKHRLLWCIMLLLACHLLRHTMRFSGVWQAVHYALLVLSKCWFMRDSCCRAIKEMQGSLVQVWGRLASQPALQLIEPGLDQGRLSSACNQQIFLQRPRLR